MNDVEPTLDNLAGLSESARERINDSRLQASYQTNQGQPARTLHPLDNFRSGPKWEVWQDEKLLGHGMNGALVVLQRKIDPPPRHGSRGAPELRAVKIIPVNDKKHKSYLRELESMIEFSRQVYSNLFVRFLGWYKFDHRLHIISEYCELGDFKKYLDERNGRLPEDQVKEVSWQILQGVMAMHKEGCVHGDIKPNNVLVIQHPPDHWWVKICDLGLSKRVEQSRGNTSKYCSPGFWPPEIFEHFDDDHVIDGYKVDMWCLGELISQALVGRDTFKSIKDMLEWCRTGTAFPDRRLREMRASDGAVDFLRSIMVSEPSRRLTAAEACGHRWMRKELNVAAKPFTPSHRPLLENTPWLWTPEVDAIFSWPKYLHFYGHYGMKPYVTNGTPLTTSSEPAPSMPIPALGVGSIGSPMAVFPGALPMALASLIEQHQQQLMAYNRLIKHGLIKHGGQAHLPSQRPRSGPVIVDHNGQVLSVMPFSKSPSDLETKEPHSKQPPPPLGEDPDEVFQERRDSTAEIKKPSMFEAWLKEKHVESTNATVESKRNSLEPSKEVTLSFEEAYKLATPLPADLNALSAKDPEKQKMLEEISRIKQAQKIMEQHRADNHGNPERVTEGPPTPLSPDNPLSQAKALAGQQPRKDLMSRPTTWAERAAQNPASRPASGDSSGAPVTGAAVEGIGPKKKKPRGI